MAEELKKRLKMVKDGEDFDLYFKLEPPQDHTTIYESVVHMLETTTESEITLGADEFRQLVEDSWDWQNSFLHSTVAYSASARSKTCK